MGEWEKEQYCMNHGIHKTTTQGYDPNANSAENAVGTLKRRARYLLSGNYLTTKYWGVAILAAAQLCRADKGLEDYPKIPFGTGVMIVRDPPPRDSFLFIAEPGTVFGPCSTVPGGMWTFHKGAVKCRTNLAVQGATPEDLV